MKRRKEAGRLSNAVIAARATRLTIESTVPEGEQVRILGAVNCASKERRCRSAEKGRRGKAVGRRGLSMSRS